VGGGVIGCAIAYRLARDGARVTVVERSRIAAESSGAAAGILAPRVHATAPKLFDLALASEPRFPPLIDALRAETGFDVEYNPYGALDLALDETGEELLRDKLRWLQEAGHGVRWVEPEDVLTMEPELAPELRGAFLDPDGFQIHPVRFTQALAQAAGRRGVRFELGAEVIGVSGKRPRAEGIRTATGEIRAGHVILAAGAWTSFCGDWLGTPIPVFPARGQILTVTAVPSPIHSIVYGAGIYLLPRVDGSVVVGATAERVGFDRNLTASAMAWLLGSIPAVCPTLAHASFDRAWTGLRPGSADDLPIIGPAPGWEDVTIATGHYRNGIMLAPLTADIVAGLVLRGEADPWLDLVRPDRFSATQRV
jgi:glycine oxidase